MPLVAQGLPPLTPTTAPPVRSTRAAISPEMLENCTANVIAVLPPFDKRSYGPIGRAPLSAGWAVGSAAAEHLLPRRCRPEAEKVAKVDISSDRHRSASGIMENGYTRLRNAFRQRIVGHRA